jgi:hypothetical protein
MPLKKPSAIWKNSRKWKLKKDSETFIFIDKPAFEKNKLNHVLSMKKTSCILLSLAFYLSWSDQVLAQDDHLKPVNGIFSDLDFQFDYYSSVRRILFAGFSDNPEIRIVIIPSFITESALDIEQDKQTEKYFLLYNKANPSIWYSHGRKKINIDSVRIEIEYNSFLLIKKLLTKAIDQVRYQSDSLYAGGFDGTSYYFSVRDKGQRTGTTWSPVAGSKMSKLVEITKQLIQLMKPEPDIIEFDATFSKEIKDLINKLE